MSICKDTSKTRREECVCLDRLPGVDGGEFHVHVVHRGEDIGGTLNDALASLRHGDGRASGDQHRLIPRAQRQIGNEMTLDQNDLRVTRHFTTETNY